MLLIDYARDVVGLPMRGLHRGHHLGWTTDKEKADALRAAGGNFTTVHDWANPGRVLGYEVSVAVGCESRDSVAA